MMMEVMECLPESWRTRNEIPNIDLSLPALTDVQTSFTFTPEEDVSDDTFTNLEVRDDTQMEDYLIETSDECEVFPIEPEIVVALNEGEDEMTIDVNLEKPEMPQIESKEDQPLGVGNRGLESEFCRIVVAISGVSELDSVLGFAGEVAGIVISLSDLVNGGKGDVRSFGVINFKGVATIGALSLEGFLSFGRGAIGSRLANRVEMFSSNSEEYGAFGLKVGIVIAEIGRKD
ncbi:hypothetical protein Syun_003893 [Stephania yunnanensis]|uniref:Uncharacterized protein n=1 Tax=Stephania yunnanensis TaxID=152371 RepID=A0AAP0L2A7_9MAGN